jgi:predicted dehydrogenase
MKKIAIIGVGYWGPNIVRNLAGLNDVSVAGICDSSSSALKRIGQQFPNICLYNDVEELISNNQVDGIVIATPASTHYELAKKALERGLHVMVEKPLATNISNAKELISMAERNDLTLMVGHTFLYSNFVREVKKRIESSELGDILYIYSQRLNLGRIRDDVDVLWNLAPHDISIINYWMNSMPTDVMASGLCYLNKDKGISDVVFAQMNYGNGVCAHLHLSWLDPLKVRRMVVVGSKKMLVYDDADGEKPIQLFDKGVEKEFVAPSDFSEFRYKLRSGDLLIPRVETKEPLKEELAHFVDCINNKRRPLTDGYHALEVISVLEAMSSSLKNKGRPINVDRLTLQSIK